MAEQSCNLTLSQNLTVSEILHNQLDSLEFKISFQASSEVCDLNFSLLFGFSVAPYAFTSSRMRLP